MTPSALIEHCAKALADAQVSFGQGTLQAADEAAWLVLWKLGLPLDVDTQTLHDELPETSIEAVLGLLTQRIQTRKPLAYLTQEAWLQGVSFYVDERCLIPRSLIAEILADGSIDPWLNPEASSALDLCTGGASLAVLVALAYPQLNVQALDISADALAVAAINVERHGLQDRVNLVASDGLEKAQGTFDLIVCNPPYVNAQSMARLPLEFQAEPSLALAGGTDGMDFIRQLLRVVPSYLKEDGVLVLEIGNEFEHFIAAFPYLEFTGLYTSAGDTQVLLITQSALLA
ncbi:MAG: 50S ribosomal protein L3 N(5)-glutamine methyltransferase [Betaproteobacteria bacterium]|nr:50S ribosomal protein L3 N(5)-glutamine methyltransferase [Betaproteobacteria bacterium]